jgi:hypothetical protein
MRTFDRRSPAPVALVVVVVVVVAAPLTLKRVLRRT